MINKKIKGESMSEQFEYLNVKTGEKFLSELSPDTINKIANDKDLDLEEYLSRIDLDAKMKSFLAKIKDVTIKVGEITVKIGKFVLNFITDLAATFDNAVKGAVIGAALGFLLMQIPLIGWILGPIALSTFVFVGTVLGLATDFINLLTSEEERESLKKMVVSRLSRISV